VSSKLLLYNLALDKEACSIETFPESVEATSDLMLIVSTQPKGGKHQVVPNANSSSSPKTNGQ